MLPTEFPEPFEACHKLIKQLETAEAVLYARMRQTRPAADKQYPSERDREVYMLGMCAVEQAKVDSLRRQWDIAQDEVELIKIVEAKQR